ncbi:hypothetical protein P3S67_005191 [Capsicum chacoense]
MKSHVEENIIDSSSSSLPQPTQPTEGEIQRSSRMNEISKSGKRKLKSKAWNHFKSIMFNGFRYDICRYCNTRIKSSRTYGTSAMREHTRRCPNKPSNLVNKSGSGGDETSQHHYFDQDVSRRELTHTIILYEYPLSVVDHIGFRKFVASLQPLFKMVSRNIIKNDILKIFDNLKSKTSTLLEKLTCRIAITTDMWTSDNNKKGFMAITEHFIDDSWKHQSHMLRFVYVPALHDKDTLCGVLLNCLSELNLKRRISTIIVDNCSTNNARIKVLLNEKLCKGDLLLMGRVFYMCCAAHILNLIVQEGLKVIGDSISNVRDSVLYWIGSPGRIERFEEAVRLLHISYSKT